ncbi:hypothetical protein G9A89_010212 [Geosiphon pyriformis]|nr:hypothetical protein G9A89_010212 [Geosiphon pyriformis]
MSFSVLFDPHNYYPYPNRHHSSSSSSSSSSSFQKQKLDDNDGIPLSNYFHRKIQLIKQLSYSERIKKREQTNNFKKKSCDNFTIDTLGPRTKNGMKGKAKCTEFKFIQYQVPVSKSKQVPQTSNKLSCSKLKHSKDPRELLMKQSFPAQQLITFQPPKKSCHTNPTVPLTGTRSHLQHHHNHHHLLLHNTSDQYLLPRKKITSFVDPLQNYWQYSDFFAQDIARISHESLNSTKALLSSQSRVLTAFQKLKPSKQTYLPPSPPSSPEESLESYKTVEFQLYD